MSKEELRNRLLGTWQLVSSVIRFEDGEFRDQLGHEPSGFLIYIAEGYELRAVSCPGNNQFRGTDVRPNRPIGDGKERLISDNR
jgi:hypothetical protein